MVWLYVLLGLLAAALLLWFLQRRKKKKALKEWKEQWFIPQNIGKAEKKQAPVKGTCSRCGVQFPLPFRCKFCGNVFCAEHRLPESHGCPGLRKLKRDGRE